MLLSQLIGPDTCLVVHVPIQHHLCTIALSSVNLHQRCGGGHHNSGPGPVTFCHSQKVYYTFSEPGKYGDGEYKTIFDGGIEAGEYKLSEKDSKNYINMGTVDLEYKIEGSELTVTYPESSDEQTGEKIPAEDYVFTRTKAPEYENESYDSFETDKALIAEWVTEERFLSYYANELSYTETVEFLENGVMVIKYYSEDLLLDRYMYYAYTVENNTLLFSLVTDKETKYKVSYTLDNDGNLKFENDETSSSIFADALFSDVTYYHKENDKN